MLSSKMLAAAAESGDVRAVVLAAVGGNRGGDDVVETADCSGGPIRLMFGRDVTNGRENDDAGMKSPARCDKGSAAGPGRGITVVGGGGRTGIAVGENPLATKT